MDLSSVFGESWIVSGFFDWKDLIIVVEKKYLNN